MFWFRLTEFLKKLVLVILAIAVSIAGTCGTVCIVILTYHLLTGNC